MASRHGGASAAKGGQEVAARGAEVMPFDLGATSHVFTKSRNGGLQQVQARNPKDNAQVRLIRSHLRDIAARFEQGDFSAPTQIHGVDMPGLEQLKQARPARFPSSTANCSTVRKFVMPPPIRRWCRCCTSGSTPSLRTMAPMRGKRMNTMPGMGDKEALAIPP